MACGMLAMQKAGIKVDEYIAYEIDKYAIQTTTHNFPDIQECGDVFQADFSQYKNIDYLIGGSPCTYWSIAQKNNRETEARGMGWELFSQYVRALREAKPKFFIYENNKSMSNAIRQSITETFGFEPICINSALVSAQNRQRLYWVGKLNDDGTYSKVDVKQPEDKEILLRDILDGNCSGIGATKEEKSYCLTSGYSNGSGENIGNYVVHTLQKGCKSMVAEPVCVASRGRNPQNPSSRKVGEHTEQRLEAHTDGKTNTITRVAKDNLVAEPVNITTDGESQCLRATCYKDGIRNIAGNDIDCKTGVAEPVCMRYERSEEAKQVRKQYEAGELHHGFHELHELHPRQDGKTNTLSTVLKDNPICEPVDTSRQVGALPRPNGELSTSQAFRVYDTEAKSVTLKAGGGGAGGKTGLYAIPVEFDGEVPTKAKSGADGKTYTVYTVADGMITIKNKTYPIKLADGYYIIRKLTVSECKRLQTIPEWFEFPVSDTQAYKMLGNGWTVDVIAHILNEIQRNEQI